MCVLYRSIYIINLRRNKNEIEKFLTREDAMEQKASGSERKKKEKSKQIYWSVYSWFRFS